MRTCPHMAITVCPLKSLCYSHMKNSLSKGIKAITIEKMENMEKSVIQDLKRGSYTHVFASQEVFTENKMWRDMLSSDAYRRRMCLFTFDAIHCMSKWGNDFRPSYKTVANIRSHLYCPVLLTTATMTESMKKDLFRLLHFEKEDLKTVAVIPDRANIFLNFKSVPGMTVENELKWLAEELREKGKEARKCIVYVRSIRKCAELWEFLTEH